MRGVITILADSFRADNLSCYGPSALFDRERDVHTPNLDAFAEEAVVFDRHYAGSYPTGPNRHDLWRGDFNFLTQGWTPIDADENSIPKVLRDSGVHSHLIFDTPIIDLYEFKSHFTSWKQIRGHHIQTVETDPAIPTDLPGEPHKFMRPMVAKQYLRNRHSWETEADYIAPRTFSAAIDWLEKNRDHEQFFLHVDAWDPHEPFDAPDHYKELYGVDDGEAEYFYPGYGRSELYDEEEHEDIQGAYAATVSMVDAHVGRFLDAIDRLGLRNEVMVVFTSDHGHIFDEHELQGKPAGSIGRLSESEVRCPLLIRHPKQTPDGSVRTITQHPDLPPTVLDALGVDIPGWVLGESLLPLVTGERDEHREYAISVRYPEGHTSPPETDAFSGPVNAVMPVTISTEKWSLLLHPDHEDSVLYDLEADPHQEHDVLEEHPNVVAELKETYLEFVTENDANDEIVEPFVDPDAYTRDYINPDHRVYAFATAGETVATVDYDEAVNRLPKAKTEADIEEIPFGEVHERDPKAYVFLGQEYYWAEDLLPTTN